MEGIAELREPSSVAGSLVYKGLMLNRLYEQAGAYIVGLAKALSWVDQKLIDAVLHFVAVASVVLSKVLALVERFLVDGPVNLVAMLSVHLGKRLSGLSSRDGQTQIIWLLLILILILVSIVLLLAVNAKPPLFPFLTPRASRIGSACAASIEKGSH